MKSELKGVVDLFVSGGAFAALRSDGSVVTWGQEGLILMQFSHSLSLHFVSLIRIKDTLKIIISIGSDF